MGGLALVQAEPPPEKMVAEGEMRNEEFLHQNSQCEGPEEPSVREHMVLMLRK